MKQNNEQQQDAPQPEKTWGEQGEAGRREFEVAVAAGADRWVPGCGGNEVPFEMNGGRWLYVFNPARHEHGWLNMETDIVQYDAPY